MFADRLLLLLLLMMMSILMIMLIVMLIMMLMVMMMIMMLMIVSIDGIFDIYMHLAGKLGSLGEATASAAAGAGTVRGASVASIEAGCIFVFRCIAGANAVQQWWAALEVRFGRSHPVGSRGVGNHLHRWATSGQGIAAAA